MGLWPLWITVFSMLEILESLSGSPSSEWHRERLFCDRAHTECVFLRVCVHSKSPSAFVHLSVFLSFLFKQGFTEQQQHWKASYGNQSMLLRNSEKATSLETRQGEVMTNKLVDNGPFWKYWRWVNSPTKSKIFIDTSTKLKDLIHVCVYVVLPHRPGG